MNKTYTDKRKTEQSFQLQISCDPVYYNQFKLPIAFMPYLIISIKTVFFSPLSVGLLVCKITKRLLNEIHHKLCGRTANRPGRKLLKFGADLDKGADVDCFFFFKPHFQIRLGLVDIFLHFSNQESVCGFYDSVDPNKWFIWSHFSAVLCAICFSTSAFPEEIMMSPALICDAWFGLL